jgi:hypothetical protein
MGMFAMRRFVIAGAAVAVLLLANSAVAITSGWSIQRTANPSGAGNILERVSCVSASICTAVGTYSHGNSGMTLAERWNGTNWSIQQTPNPSGGGALSGVSCVSASACTAVGESGTGTGASLVERGNGTKWSIQHIPNPTGASSTDLDAVSCVSASVCTAVGSYTKGNSYSYMTLAERWNGTKWSIQQTPNPSGGGALFGVSCASASACIAVGEYNDGHAEAMLAERWNGTKWSIQPTPNQTGASVIAVPGVSCASVRACTAVGETSEGTLAERWNGSKWSIQPTPTTGGADNYLEGVSCASASVCTAVGNYESGGVVTLAEGWRG